MQFSLELNFETKNSQWVFSGLGVCFACSQTRFDPLPPVWSSEYFQEWFLSVERLATPKHHRVFYKKQKQIKLPISLKNLINTVTKTDYILTKFTHTSRKLTVLYSIHNTLGEGSRLNADLITRCHLCV